MCAASHHADFFGFCNLSSIPCWKQRDFRLTSEKTRVVIRKKIKCNQTKTCSLFLTKLCILTCLPDTDKLSFAFHAARVTCVPGPCLYQPDWKQFEDCRYKCNKLHQCDEQNDIQLNSLLKHVFAFKLPSTWTIEVYL